jgi:hypothetical protein
MVRKETLNFYARFLVKNILLKMYKINMIIVYFIDFFLSSLVE